MITSTGEVFKNPTYVNTILYCNSVLKSPFKWIELQTSGYGLSEHFVKSGLAKEVSWVSLSMIDPVNLKANQHAMGLTFKMEDVFSLLKEHDINMRLSLNLTDIYSEFKYADWKNLLKKIFEKGFKQVTFRILYSDSSDKEQSNWIKKHGLGENTEAIVALQEYIRQEGYLLGKLPFGVAKYSIEGMCTIIDDDCMAQSVKDIDTYKSLILRQDGHLYTSWADNASLLF
jgi:hypothetical protein